MIKSDVEISRKKFPLYSMNTLIIGSGAAGLAAAVWLHRFGIRDMAISTENWSGGTSCNAGSDKQTYYKLSLSPDVADSALQMAEDLARGGCMHGDIALCEAQHSLQAFYNLVGLGVPFPHDRYGAYVGYKTDHDPRQRATSAGPLTSRLMFDALAREVIALDIPVYNNMPIIGLLTEGGGEDKRVVGAIGFDKEACLGPNFGLVLFNAVNVILATGGPAGIYRDSVYPETQTGGHGLALGIGAVGQNLTESQFGLASVKLRWNLSGSYQQVIPRYYSTSAKGTDEREFLNEVFPDMGRLSTAIFLKGYQWPFDPRKLADYGSSLIDLLVCREITDRNRRVFLDFTRNPSDRGPLDEFRLDRLAAEAYSYLQKSGALQSTPVARLEAMNQPAAELFKARGIDLGREPLEIALCHQHNNGGLKGNIWWETTVKHLFAVGEVNGSHGVTRPGGSALNSGQVGALRAALYISRRYADPPASNAQFLKSTMSQVQEKFDWAGQALKGSSTDTRADEARDEIQRRMSSCGSAIRSLPRVEPEVPKAWALYARLKKSLRVKTAAELAEAFKLLDLCLTHAVYLEAVQEYLEKNGKSRGSFLVLDPVGAKIDKTLENKWRTTLAREEDFASRHILEISLGEDMAVEKRWVPARPIPREEHWFETIWNEFRKDNIIR